MMVRSRSSRRRAPIQRSANAFATGGAHRCLEDLHTFGSEDLVEGVDELVAAVAHERTRPGEPVGMAQEQVPRCLGDPHAGGVVRDPCAVHGSGGDVDAQQQVEPAQRDGFDGGEVAGDSGLGPQELRPSDFAACGCRVDSGVVEDLSDRGRSKAVAEPGKFALTRRYPQVGFSAPRRSASRQSSAEVDGRPGGRCG